MKESSVAVVTGSNKGIGLAIVKELCTKFDGDVYLTSRNEAIGKEAVAQLETLGLHPKYHQLDIDDESSVLKLKDYLESNYGGLDVLVNNAAISFWPDSPLSFHEKSVQTLRTNYFNTKRTCDILFPILKPHARVVNVSSCAGHLSKITKEELRSKFAPPNLTYGELDKLMEDFIEAVKLGDHGVKGWPNVPISDYYGPNAIDVMGKIMKPKGYSDEEIEKVVASPAFTPYEVSKIGICALTRIQQRDFDKDDLRPDIIVNSVHPGYVDTDMTRHSGGVTIEEGAVAPSWLALLPANVEGPKGEFVWKDKSIVDWVNGPMPGPF